MADLPTDSPWLDAPGAATYLPGKRSARFVKRQMKAGLIRHARIGGKGEYVTRREWLDDYIVTQATPITALRRRA